MPRGGWRRQPTGTALVAPEACQAGAISCEVCGEVPVMALDMHGTMDSALARVLEYRQGLLGANRRDDTGSVLSPQPRDSLLEQSR